MSFRYQKTEYLHQGSKNPRYQCIIRRTECSPPFGVTCGLDLWTVLVYCLWQSNSLHILGRVMATQSHGSLPNHLKWEWNPRTILRASYATYTSVYSGSVYSYRTRDDLGMGQDDTFPFSSGTQWAKSSFQQSWGLQ